MKIFGTAFREIENNETFSCQYSLETFSRILTFYSRLKTKNAKNCHQYVKKLKIFCENFCTISLFSEIFIYAKMSPYFRENLAKREQLEEFLEIFFTKMC
jgi:hypothetical protein